MNERAYYNDYTIPRDPRPQTDLASILTSLLAFILFACVAWPLLSDTDALRRYARALYDMIARHSFGLLTRPMQGFGSETAVASVFGLPGAETLQRGYDGLRSFVSGSAGGEGRSAPAGLGNMNNSCYQNSVIQGLASLRCFPPFLRRVAGKGRGEASMNEALLGMLERLNDGRSGGSHLWLSSELKTMSTFQQQDAQEYFSKILDKVDSEALKVAKEEAEAQRKDAGLASPQIHHSTPTEEKLEEETLRNPLEGLIAQRVGCKSCGHSDGISLIPFNCLTVPLRAGTSMQDIRDCLDESCALEEIDGVQCPKCTILSHKAKLETMLRNPSTSDEAKTHFQKRMDAVEAALREGELGDEVITRKLNIPKKQWQSSTKTKQAVVARPPGALILHVNRSMFNEVTGAQIKNPAAVCFPAILGLGPWTIGKTQEGEEGREEWSMQPGESMLPEWSEEGEKRGARYELRAVVTHQGRHENGHYIAWRKYSFPTPSSGSEKTENEESWYRLSDEYVDPVTEEDVLREGGVFMLFYEKLPSSPDLNEKPTLEIPTATLNTATMTPPPEALTTALPPVSPDELDALLAEDEYVLADPPRSWQPPTPEPEQEQPESEPITPVEDAMEKEKENEPVKAIRMRTSSLLGDDRPSKGSSENLRLGSRMVSAS